VKQVLQNLKSGATTVADVPVPSVSDGQLLISTSASLISAGTEKMLVEFGRGGLIEKARQQPDKVRMVLDKIRTDGLQPTFQSVVSKLDQPFPLGYCNVGRVTSVGSGVTGFQLKDRVVSNGKHAEVVSVPINLCARVPDNVSDEEAAFAVLGAVALQGIRLAQPTLGETVVVTGLGLVGLLTVQLLRAHGCRVLGLDFDSDKLALAKQFGAEVVDLAAGQDPIDVASNYSRGRGADAVIIAAATQSSAPIHQAALMCRKRGRIVLVGVTGLELSRDDFFEKELTFQVSASYGPGRFDPNYEEKGQDYPIGFVRWTEQRNFEAVLDMMSDGRLNVKPLISHRFDIGEAEKAYDLVSAGPTSLGILLQYPGLEVTPASCSVPINPALQSFEESSSRNNERVGISFIGAGNYAKATLIPAFKALRAPFRLVASSTGVSGMHAGRKFGFEEATTDTSKLFADQATRAVVITTRHDTHGCYVVQALRSGKDVFVEKPLCLSLQELAEIQDAYFEACEGPTGPPVVMVGFNRRFAPQVKRIKQLLEGVSGPKSFVLTVNAGAVSSKHWTHDADVGGGRIVGEACHFIDLLRFLAGAPIKSWHRFSMDSDTNDTVSLHLCFQDGSIGAVHYFANGSKAFPKERLEVFASGRILHLDNFRKLSGYGWPSFKAMNLWRQDKGQNLCAKEFLDAVAGSRRAPIPFDELIEVSRTSIELAST